jgi:hypothetical protein
MPRGEAHREQAGVVRHLQAETVGDPTRHPGREGGVAVAGGADGRAERHAGVVRRGAPAGPVGVGRAGAREGREQVQVPVVGAHPAGGPVVGDGVTAAGECRRRPGGRRGPGAHRRLRARPVEDQVHPVDDDDHVLAAHGPGPARVVVGPQRQLGPVVVLQRELPQAQRVRDAADLDERRDAVHDRAFGAVEQPHGPHQRAGRRLGGAPRPSGVGAPGGDGRERQREQRPIVQGRRGVEHRLHVAGVVDARLARGERAGEVQQDRDVAHPLAGQPGRLRLDLLGGVLPLGGFQQRVDLLQRGGVLVGEVARAVRHAQPHRHPRRRAESAPVVESAQ